MINNARKLYDKTDSAIQMSSENQKEIRNALENAPVQKYLRALKLLIKSDRDLLALENTFSSNLRERLQNPSNRHHLTYESYFKIGYSKIFSTPIAHFELNVSNCEGFDYMLNHNRATHITLDEPLDILQSQSVVDHTWRHYEVDVMELGDATKQIAEIVFEYQKGLVGAKEKKEQYISGIRELINHPNINTLKAFLKEWPAGEAIVPPEVLQKLHQKENRVKKVTEKVAVNFDLNAANTVVLTAKLLG
jgi:hypothetical protein